MSPPATAHFPAVPGADRPAFDLTVGDHAGHFLVLSLRGREALSRLYSFDVLAIASEARAGTETALLGETATLRLDVPDGERREIAGIVAEVSAEGTHPTFGAAAFRLRIVPRMWLLRRSRNTRIFQDVTVPDIVTEVLAGLDVPCEWRLRHTHTPKVYCVQYQETDFDFVSRILAEEGIFFFFESPRPGAVRASDVAVFCDAADYPVIAGEPAVHFRPESGLTFSEERITTFAVRRRVRPRSVLLKDFDYQRPLLDLTAEAIARDDAEPAHGLGADMPRVYHPVSDYEDPEIRQDRATRLLAQLRRSAHVSRAESSCRRLSPGHRFQLADHPNETLNHAHAVTRVEHEGRLPDRARGASGGESGPVYQNTFECVPADVVYRPRRPSRTPRQVLETAIVVGPPGETIYTDRLGRIKVQFHWDRDGVRNEHSSCWLRVSQAWAGPSWGFQFIPRIGMEVLVSFIGGDPDRPVVTGCLYNPLNPPSHDLPVNATKSGIRTRTVPGHDGYNELSFEDRLGREMVYLQAERDFSEVVKNDHSLTVGRFDPGEPVGDQRVRIARDQNIEIGGDRVLKVEGDRQQTIVGDDALVVAGGLSSEVSGLRFDQCESWVQQTDSTYQLEVGGDAASSVAGDATSSTNGDREEDVGSAYTVRVGEHMACSVGRDYSLSAVLGVTLTSAESIRLVCGDSSIDLGPSEIVITSPNVTVAATQAAAMVAEGVSLHLENKKAALSATEKVELFSTDSEVELTSSGVVAAARKQIKLFSQGASVVLDTDASMDGALVKLNCGGPQGSPEDKEPDEIEVSWVDIALTQPAPKQGDPTQIEQRPVPGARYVVEAANGRVYRGTLDGEGKARVAVPPGPVEVTFPDHEAGCIKPK